jgi:outer membrane protein assembly factor BamC
VRYEDVDASGRQKKGFMSRMAFWRKDDIDRVQQYQIRVQGDDTQSRVSVLDKNGNPDGSPAASRILALLSENMR